MRYCFSFGLLDAGGPPVSVVLDVGCSFSLSFCSKIQIVWTNVGRAMAPSFCTYRLLCAVAMCARCIFWQPRVYLKLTLAWMWSNNCERVGLLIGESVLIWCYTYGTNHLLEPFRRPTNLIIYQPETAFLGFHGTKIRKRDACIGRV